MLETVKAYIQNVPKIPFHQFFHEYMLSVQDSNIDREFRYLVNRNALAVDAMDVLINNTIERLGCIHDNC